MPDSPVWLRPLDHIVKDKEIIHIAENTGNVRSLRGDTGLPIQLGKEQVAEDRGRTSTYVNALSLGKDLPLRRNMKRPQIHRQKLQKATKAYA